MRKVSPDPKEMGQVTLQKSANKTYDVGTHLI